MERVIATRAVVGIWNMQVCAHEDVPDEEILREANRLNPSGTTNGWTTVIRDGGPGREPVRCRDYSDRFHYLLSC